MNIVSTVTKRTVWIDARARWRASHVKDHVIVLGDMPEVATELDRMGVDTLWLQTTSPWPLAFRTTE